MKVQEIYEKRNTEQTLWFFYNIGKHKDMEKKTHTLAQGFGEGQPGPSFHTEHLQMLLTVWPEVCPKERNRTITLFSLI